MNTNTRSRLAVGSSAMMTILLVTAPAHAQPEYDDDVPLEPRLEPRAGDRIERSNRGVFDDPHADRTFLAPTALTQPAGSVSVNAYQLLFAGLTVGLTDDFQISAGALLPLFEDPPLVGALTAKAQLVRAGQLRLALHGNVTGYLDRDGDDDEAVALVGGVVTVCLDIACRSNLNGYLGYSFLLDSEDSAMVAAASITLRVSRYVKLLGEIDTGLVTGEDFENTYLGWYGVRFAARHVAADVGFVKPIRGELDDDDGLLLGIPWVAVTYRGGL